MEIRKSCADLVSRRLRRAELAGGAAGSAVGSGGCEGRGALQGLRHLG